jgi:hypothetical protein
MFVAQAPTASFWHLARANAEGRQLGPVLTQLLSSDVRFIPGLHREGASGTAVANPTPGHTGYGKMSAIALWEAAPARPASSILLNVSATSRSKVNDGLRGDVLVGFFNPLPGTYGAGANGTVAHVMVLNGLTDRNGSAAATEQAIQLTLAGSVASVERLSRATGQYERLNTAAAAAAAADEPSRRELVLVLPGGTADLLRLRL